MRVRVLFLPRRLPPPWAARHVQLQARDVPLPIESRARLFAPQYEREARRLLFRFFVLVGLAATAGLHLGR